MLHHYLLVHMSNGVHQFWLTGCSKLLLILTRKEEVFLLIGKYTSLGNLMLNDVKVLRVNQCRGRKSDL